MTGNAASFGPVRAEFAKNLGGAALVAAALVTQSLPSAAQTPCPSPAYRNPTTEIVSSQQVLLGTINLTEQFIPMPQPGDTNCTPRPSQLVRVFQGYQGNVTPPTPPPGQPPILTQPVPGRRCGRASATSCSSASSTRSTRTISISTSISMPVPRWGRTVRPIRDRQRMRCRTACTHRARRTSISTERTPARKAPPTMCT